MPSVAQPEAPQHQQRALAQRPVPREQAVKVGQKVTWTNDDGVDHNVTATEGAKFSSDNFGQGGTYSFTPTRPGKIEYTCTLHPGMNGELTVSG